MLLPVIDAIHFPDLSVAVPITNSLTMIITTLTGKLLGEDNINAGIYNKEVPCKTKYNSTKLNERCTVKKIIIINSFCDSLWPHMGTPWLLLWEKGGLVAGMPDSKWRELWSKALDRNRNRNRKRLKEN